MHVKPAFFFFFFFFLIFSHPECDSDLKKNAFSSLHKYNPVTPPLFLYAWEKQKCFDDSRGVAMVLIK